MSEAHKIAVLLRSVQGTYSTLVTALLTRGDDDLTLVFVKQALLDEEQRRGQLTFLLTLKTLHYKQVVGEQEVQILPPVLIVGGKVILLATALSLNLLSNIMVQRKLRNRKTQNLTWKEEMRCLLQRLD